MKLLELNTQLLLAIITISINSFATNIGIEYSDINKYLNKIDLDEMPLIYEVRKKEFNEIEAKSILTKLDKNAETYEERFPGIKSYSDDSYNLLFDEKEGLYRFRDNTIGKLINVKADDRQKSEELKIKAQNIFQNILNKESDKFKFNSISDVMEQKKGEKSPTLIFRRFIYTRTIDSRSVTDYESYVKITLGEDGLLYSLDIKNPEFISEKPLSAKFSKDYHNKAIINKIKSLKPYKFMGDAKEYRILNAKILTATDSYIVMNVAGKKMAVPHKSYFIEFTLEGSKKVKQFVHVSEDAAKIKDGKGIESKDIIGEFDWSKKRQ